MKGSTVERMPTKGTIVNGESSAPPAPSAPAFEMKQQRTFSVVTRPKSIEECDISEYEGLIKNNQYDILQGRLRTKKSALLDNLSDEELLYPVICYTVIRPLKKYLDTLVNGRITAKNFFSKNYITDSSLKVRLRAITFLFIGIEQWKQHIKELTNFKDHKKTEEIKLSESQRNEIRKEEIKLKLNIEGSEKRLREDYRQVGEYLQANGTGTLLESMRDAEKDLDLTTRTQKSIKASFTDLENRFEARVIDLENRFEKEYVTKDEFNRRDEKKESADDSVLSSMPIARGADSVPLPGAMAPVFSPAPMRGLDPVVTPPGASSPPPAKKAFRPS